MREEVAVHKKAAEVEFRRTHVDRVSMYALGASAVSLFVCMAYLVARSISSVAAVRSEHHQRQSIARGHSGAGFSMAETGPNAILHSGSGAGLVFQGNAHAYGSVVHDTAYFETQG